MIKPVLPTISNLMILITLAVILPVMAQEVATCTITASQNVNRRDGPGTSFNIADVLPAHQRMSVDGQTTGTDDLVWWELNDGTWVRSDTVSESGDCESLADVFASPMETPTPSVRATETLISEPTTNDEVSAYSIGDQVTVFGSNIVFLIYAEPSVDAYVVEATISGIVLTIIAGPDTSGRERWWQVRSPSSLEGWVPETIDGQPALLLPGMSQVGVDFALSIGSDAIVTGVGKVLLIHSEPNNDASVVEATVSGVILTVIGGPEMVENETWWQVRSPSGLNGWVPEKIDQQATILSPDAIAALNVPTPTTTYQIVVEIAATVNTDKLNVRRGPGPEYDKVVELSNGQDIILIGRNTDSTWVQLRADDQRWVNARYVRIDGSISTLPVSVIEKGEWGPPGQPTGARARATTVLRLRGGPGADYRQLEDPDSLKPGDVVDVVGRTGDGVWYQVNVNNRSAWIRSEGIALSGNTNGNIPVTFP